MAKASLRNSDYFDRISYDILSRLRSAYPVGIDLSASDIALEQIDEEEDVSRLRRIYAATLYWLRDEGYLRFSHDDGQDLETRRFFDVVISHRGLVLDGAPPKKFEAITSTIAPFTLLSLSLGEFLTLLTVVYLCCMAAFNAGYFLRIPTGFVNFFSFQDLLISNIPLVQFALPLLSVIWLTSVAHSLLSEVPWTKKHVIDRMRAFVDRSFNMMYGDETLNILVFTSVMFLQMIIGIFLHDTYFYLDMLPFTFLVGLIISFQIYGVKNGYLRIKSAVIWLTVALVAYSFSFGSTWLFYEIKPTNESHSFVVSNGICVERILLRTSSSGMLLYNPSLRRFEFRGKDDMQRVFPGKACI